VTAPHPIKTSARKPDTCSVCKGPAVISEVHHPRAATIHLGGRAWAHPDLVPLLRNLYEGEGTDLEDTTPVIRRHPDNPRRGDHDAIVKSVLNNGVYTPPKVQVSTGYVLAGNHSFDAMIDAGARQMPWVWLDVDDREARRIMADDNRTAELGGYDEQMLLLNLRALEAEGDLDLTAWTSADLDHYASLLEVPWDPEAGQPDPDQALRDAGVDDFQNEDQTAAYSIKVNFASLEDVKRFAELLGVKRPRRRMWFPEVEDLIESETEYIALEEDGAPADA